MEAARDIHVWSYARPPGMNWTPEMGRDRIQEAIDRVIAERAHDAAKFGALNPQWSPRVQAAYAFAKARHAGQFRRNGVTPYIEHVEQVMARAGNNELNLIVAALHDLVEDKRATIQEIEAQSFWSADITDGVLTVTRRDDETYATLITRIAIHRGGRWRPVKIADNLANLADSPMPSQIKRYAKALVVLTS